MSVGFVLLGVLLVLGFVRKIECFPIVLVVLVAVLVVWCGVVCKWERVSNLHRHFVSGVVLRTRV